MSLSLVTAPVKGAVTLEDALAHLRIDVTDEQDLIESLMAAGREYVEVFTHRKLITQTWDLKLDGFPCGAIELPFPPVSSVTSVSYVDTSGATTIWAAGATGYTTDLPTGPYAAPGRLYPSYGVAYPSTRLQPNAVTVRFTCGYGIEPAYVPASLRAAVLLMVGTWYAHRETVVTGVSVTEVPQTASVLLWPFKAFSCEE